MLIIKMRATAVPAVATFSAVGGVALSAGSAGLSTLVTYERAGLIRRVVPLRAGRAASAARSLGAIATLAGVSPQMPEGQSGVSPEVSICQFNPGAEVAALQAALAADPHIELCSRVPVRYLMAKRKTAATRRGPTAARAVPTATPPSATTLWDLAKIRWREAINGGLSTADQIHVAVLDTGIDLGHPDLPGSDINYVYNYPDSQVTTSDRDIIGHGTHVSGTIRALIDSGIGINGMCKCRLSVYKIFGDDPAPEPVFDPFPNYPYYVDPILYRAALAACQDAGVQVINLSIGGSGPPDPVEAALFQGLIQSGVAVVAAMGNAGSAAPSYPAAFPGVIAVGASALDDTIAAFSNYGSHISLCAPGVSVWSTLPTYEGQTGFYAVQGTGGTWHKGLPMRRETDYDAWQGTSMATPHVVGAAAMALGQFGAMAPSALKSRLENAAVKVSAMQRQPFTIKYGYGRLDLLNLLS
jgi:subtilisin family serine protease